MMTGIFLCSLMALQSYIQPKDDSNETKYAFENGISAGFRGSGYFGVLFGVSGMVQKHGFSGLLDLGISKTDNVNLGYSTDSKGNCHDNSNGQFAKKEYCSPSIELLPAVILEYRHDIKSNISVGGGFQISSDYGPFLASRLQFRYTAVTLRAWPNFFEAALLLGFPSLGSD